MPRPDMKELKIDLDELDDTQKYVDHELLHKEFSEVAEIFGISVLAENDVPHTLIVHFKGEPGIGRADLRRIFRKHKPARPKTLEQILEETADPAEKMDRLERFIRKRFGKSEVKE